jgi:PAS domain S-box-containing protein
MASASGSVRLSGHDRRPRERGPWLLVAGFVVVAAIVVALAVIAWREQAHAMRATVDRSVSAVAELRADQISAWLSERHADAEVIRDDSLLSVAIGDLLASRGGSASEADIAARLAAIQTQYDYAHVALVRPDGEVVLRSPQGDPYALDEPSQALLQTAVRTGEVQSTDLHLDAAGRPRIDVIVPVPAEKTGDQAIAAVVLNIDPARFLFPLIQGPQANRSEWPLETSSGEVLLVERRGNDVVFLNELRFREGAALRLTASANEADLPAAKAVRGEVGVVEGIDYRGVPVIAALKPVPGTRWFAIAKVDTSEVLGPIEQRGWITVGFTILAVALGAAGSLLLWRARESQVAAKIAGSESRFRSLFENMAASVALHELVRSASGDPLDYRIIDVNPAFSAQTGMAAETVRERLASEAYGTPAPPFMDRYSQVVTHHEPQRFKTRFEPLDRHFDVSVIPQGGDRFATVFEDVTERERTVEELREREERLRFLIDQTPTINWTVDRDLRFTLSRGAGLQALGLGPDEALGAYVGDFFGGAGQQADLGVAMHRRALAGATFTYEQPIGDLVLEIILGALRDADGEIVGVIGVAYDATARKKADAARTEAERKLTAINADLDRRVAKRTAELDAANKELEAFAYTVSHDLRAPLRHISGFSSLLTKRAGDSLDEKSRHYLATISSSVREMGALIDDLLQFSRTGRTELKIEPVDTNATLAEALAPLKHEADGRAIEWSIDPLPSVVGDHALLRQVWANLLGNAVKYTRGRTPARIAVGGYEADGEVVLFVRDNGVGFDMKYAHKLFGVFQRLHSASEFEGTGIGLANVQRIVTRLGGRAWAESKMDQGATFFFSLPRQKER